MEYEERFAELERRIAELESVIGAAGEPARVTGVAQNGFWALTAWKQQLADAGMGSGGVLYTGSVRIPSGKHYEWQIGFDTESLLGGDLGNAAETLAALGNPVRLLMLHEVLLGRCTVSALTEVVDLGSAGQIYHHLRQLTTAGWLHSASRGNYSVPADRVVPLLVALAITRR
ncbi:ArsR/SmtB family transcription factor [Streptacidiphilus sp. PAMC 29251]